jgi:tetratricopeptide (TPR) repeat protein
MDRTTDVTSQLCPDERLAECVAVIQGDPQDGMIRLENLLVEFEGDPRLHFLNGSLLAGAKDYAAARVAMRRAVDLAPDFAIARFQLGFLLLTSGEPHAAQEAWGPLHGLPRDHYLHHFVLGLCHLIRDEFSAAIAELQEGIGRNAENPPLNNDMQLIIDEVRRKDDTIGSEAPLSSAQSLLQQASLRNTRH